MKKTIGRLIFFPVVVAMFVTAGWSQSAAAQEPGHSGCPDYIVKSVGEFFHLENFAYDGRIVAGKCKPMPDKPSRTIGAFAYRMAEETRGEAGIVRLLLVLYDETLKRIVSSCSSTDHTDAETSYDSNSITIDTGRYVLAQNVRAFGIRLNTYVWHRFNELTYGDDLTLYVPEGRNIRPVFRAFMKFGGLGVDCREDMCEPNGNIIESEKFISIEKTTSNGFADLKLSVKVKDPRIKLKPLIVKYNGERYDFDGRWSENELDRRLIDEMDKLLHKPN